MDITFKCAQCDQAIKVDEAGAGLAVACPSCGADLLVPRKSTPTTSRTKTCPFCAESIQADAIKCKHCGEFLSGRPPIIAIAPQIVPQAKPDNGSLIGCGYLFACLFPILGIVFGIILLCRDEAIHGRQAILLSIVAGIVWTFILFNM